MENVSIQTKVISGKAPGKRVAVLCGVHGNEKAGIATVDYLSRNLAVARGEVVLVYANPPAIEQHIRLINQNLNRLCIRGLEQTSYENVLAEQIMDLADTCDALIDLHSYNEPQGDAIPFIICESDCYELASKMDFEIVTSGFDALEEGGTDTYIRSLGKSTMCVELGSVDRPQDYIELGIKTVYQFLQHFDVVDIEYADDDRKQVFLKVDMVHKRQSEDFSFIRPFLTFDEVKAGEVIAMDGGEACVAPMDARIIFPRDTFPIGAEAFILATEST